MTNEPENSPHSDSRRSDEVVPAAQPTESPSRAAQVRIIAGMYIGYAMFMVLRMAPSVAGASIVDNPELGIDKGDWGRILAMGTIGAVVGKFLGGLAADRFGGRWTFTIGLIISSIGVAAFAGSTTVALFQASFFLTLMAKSAGWPSMTRIIIDSFRPAEYGRVWGILSTSSRIGTLVATFCLGGMLSLLAWQSMLFASAASGLLLAVVFFLLLHRNNGRTNAAPSPESPAAADSSAPPHPLDGKSLYAALKVFARSRQFWLITASLMCLTIMWDFLLMVPLYLKDTLALSPARASVTSSAFPFGSLISVLIGGWVFDKLSRRATARLMGALLVVATACIATFLVMPRLDLSPDGAVSVTIALLFIFGLCVSPCYYIPMSVFSIEFGGPRSGFLVALLDAIAFGATAAFYARAGEIAKRSWSAFLLVLVVICLLSALTTWQFLRGEAKREHSAADEKNV